MEPRFPSSQVAASGGYMMACIADWLVAAPFAMLGSIGVVGGIPNFNKALKKAGVEYFHFTAGIFVHFKRYQVYFFF